VRSLLGHTDHKKILRI